MKNSSVLPRMLRDKVQKTGSAVFRVTGWSMIPAIWPYARITVKKTAFEALREGDVICYDLCGRMHCHRVIAITSEMCFTQGDSVTDVLPEMVSRDDVIGRVECVAIGSYSMSYDSRIFRCLAVISPKTGKILKKILQNTVYSSLLRPLTSRITSKIKS